MASYNIPKNSCHDWPLGQCKHGNECFGEHHHNLNPALFSTGAHPEYVVPNDVGEACLRCTQRMYPVSSWAIKGSSYANSARSAIRKGVAAKKTLVRSAVGSVGRIASALSWIRVITTRHGRL
jgi:hypothetical protein